MAHPDPYRLTGTPPADHRGGTADGGVDLTRTLLWSLLVLSAAANMATSYGGVDAWVNVTCGVLTLLSAGALVVRRLRGHR
ncbi:hypothetical protein AB0D74_04040 [Streptomyces sp. NPDC048278]|uniref:hypothetical protein n=1 Tax=unclassified Streptomyces TaxID=2593676 RepID=UPI00343C0CE4